MSSARYMYGLVSYGDAVYAIGGYGSGELQTMERYSRKLGWVSLANLPFKNHRLEMLKMCP